MSRDVEYTPEFEAWWNSLTADEQADITHCVQKLERRGPEPAHPYSSSIRGSRHGVMRELRVQSRGKPIRILYAFDSRRVAILLIGGKKGGNDRFYNQFVAVADELFDRHLAELRKETENAEHSTVLRARSENTGGRDGTRRGKT